MKPLQQYFHMVLFISRVVLTFKSVDEILWVYYSKETFLADLCMGLLIVFCRNKKNIFLRGGGGKNLFAHISVKAPIA